MKKIFVIGSINIDLVIKAPYMPASGETLTGNGFFTAHGGKGANQAIAAARLGGNVIMCGCVGDDEFGKSALQSLHQEGIDISHIRTVKNTPTGTAVILVINGDNRIVLERGANAALSFEDVDNCIAKAEVGDILLVQLENPVEVIGYAMKKGKEKGMLIVLNPAPADKSIDPFLTYCDIITPNETEIEILGGKDSLAKKVNHVIVTLGSKGFEIIKKDMDKSYPCKKVKAVDTTAAGDTFCGGMVARLALGETLEEATLFGSAAASLACTRQGAQPSIPTVSETINFIKGAEQ